MSAVVRITYVRIYLSASWVRREEERERGGKSCRGSGWDYVCVCMEERQRCRGRDRGRGIKYVIIVSVLFRGLFSFDVRFAVKTIYAHVSMLAYL